ncbi:MAG: V-type ATP synthase subunit I [Treponema sp.]|nr:V-type ATP synthase subunit I [Treponema sp.]
MKKMCLVVQEKSRVETCEKLREVGVVHLEIRDIPAGTATKAQKCKVKVEESLGLISEYKLPKKKKKLSVKFNGDGSEQREKHTGVHRGRRATDLHGTEDEVPFSLNAILAAKRPYLPELIVRYGRERKALKEQDIILTREVTRIEEWGDFDPSVVESIIEYGVPVWFYEVSQDVLSKFDDSVKYIKVKNEKSKDKSIVRIVVFYEKLPGLVPFVLPEKRLGEYKEEIDTHKIALQEIEDKLKGFADRRPFLNKEMEKIAEELEFESAVAGMEKLDVDSDIITSSGGICYLTGFVPSEDLENVKAAAKENNWALSAVDPDPQDEPPTKLKNNSFVRMINPLFSFMGTYPAYREFDISPSYLFFFSIFFAMILGDAGYGALLFSVGLLTGVLLKIKKGTVPDIVKLLMLLTFTTIVWGAINGSWFQIPYENLPVFLQALVIPHFNNLGPLAEFPPFLQGIFRLPAELPVGEAKTAWNIQFLCFTIALFQLVWARGKKFLSVLPSLKAFSHLGTLFMVVGIYFLVLNVLLNIEMPPFAMPLVITGVAFNLIFSAQNGGNFLVNVGKGAAGFFELFLKVVGCFGDIVSYIRLYAVGLAGGIIAQIFNNLAIGDGFGDFGVVFILRLIPAILILVAGHGLNLILTALSVIVHGARLNLLEYAGNHLEMEWSGYLYNPFALKKKEK